MKLENLFGEVIHLKRSLKVYVIVDNWLKQDILDISSDYFTIVTKVRIRGGSSRIKHTEIVHMQGTAPNVQKTRGTFSHSSVRYDLFSDQFKQYCTRQNITEVLMRELVNHIT